MLKKVGRYALQSVALSLAVAPLLLDAQDLGSSNNLFRLMNSAAKTAPGKRAAKKTTAQTVAKKESSRRHASARKQTAVAVRAEAKAAQPALKINPVGETIVIRIGATKASEETDRLFDKAIEQGNQARAARNYVSAEAAYRQAQRIKPKDSLPVYGLGNLLSDQQRWEEAEKAYRQAVEFEPSSPKANLALSFVLAQPVGGANLMERYAEAENAARKAIALDPANAAAYDQLGVALEARGLTGAETKNAYRKAVELDSYFALAYAHLGRFLRRTGFEDESSAADSDAIRMAVEPLTMIRVADVMQSQQRYAESEELLRRALKSDPKNPTGLFLLGRGLTMRGEFAEAEKLLKTSVEVSPKSFVAYALLGSLYARRKNYEKAEKTLQKALPVVSENEKKRLAQEFEFVADGLMRAGKKKDAARIYQQAIKLDGDKTSLGAKLSEAQKVGAKK